MLCVLKNYGNRLMPIAQNEEGLTLQKQVKSAGATNKSPFTPPPGTRGGPPAKEASTLGME